MPTKYSALLKPLYEINLLTKLAGFSVNPDDHETPLHLSMLGLTEEEKNQVLELFPYADLRDNKQEFYFLGSELRPGSGIVRVFGGQPEGPGGTLTCFLSSRDGRDVYFVAAGHVLSNFWSPDDKKSLESSIYLYRKGYPSAVSSRFLGRWPLLAHEPIYSFLLFSDMGIVRMTGDFEWKQRTTGFGSFGEWPPGEPANPTKGMRVMKCGAEEVHWTEAVVTQIPYHGWVHGPNKRKYFLANQALIETASLNPQDTIPPNNPEGTPFAVSGDSGTMVVDQQTKRPVGMLIAGSVLAGRYIMTPIRTLYRFWTKKGLILLRA